MPRKQAQSASSFPLVSSYKLGYRNREDTTNLPPGVLIVGSKNVLTNVSERVQIRQGYSLDGQVGTVSAPILSSFDFQTRGNGEVHLRAGFLTEAGDDGKLQYRYVDEDGVVTWRDLLTDLESVRYNFTTFWDNTEQLRVCLFVNGESQIQEWNGATTTVLSSTANTITKNGTTTWAEEGFYAAGNKKVVINGTEYTYSGGETTTTLTGVSPSPATEPVDAVVHQQVITVANSAMTNSYTGFSTYKNNLIQVLNNQVFLGSLTSPVFFVSKFNSYTDYSFSSPRLPAEGAIGTLDANLVAFKVQENVMYISAGRDFWYNTTFTLSSDITKEAFTVIPLKDTPSQGALSQAFVSHMKNNIIMITHEPTMDIFGRLENILGTPQTKNLSDPIKLDFDQYDFTDGSISYWRYFILVAVPSQGLVRIFNLNTNNWEAPQTLPISRFYTVDGELYGHSYQISESYKLFTGYADRVYPGFPGYPIDMQSIFSYQNFGTRTDLKSADALYVEGYINSNTTATCTITYEIDGCAKTNSFEIVGSNTQIVCIPTSYASLGKVSLGKQKLGGDETENLTGLPPKFRVIFTFPNYDFFECSISFEVYGTDNRFELIAFGPNASMSTQEPVYIKT